MSHDMPSELESWCDEHGPPVSAGNTACDALDRTSLSFVLAAKRVYGHRKVSEEAPLVSGSYMCGFLAGYQAALVEIARQAGSQ